MSAEIKPYHIHPYIALYLYNIVNNLKEPIAV